MIAFLTFLACGDKTNDTATTIDDTAVTTDTDTVIEEPVPFQPTEGHWIYSGGALVEAGTTCTFGTDSNGDLTDPVGFSLSLIEGGFQILSDEAGSTPVTCLLADPTSPDPGGYSCDSSSSENWFYGVYEDDANQEMDIKMKIDTTMVGEFAGMALLQNTFTLTLTCLEVDYWLGGSCSDMQQYFPTPCDIQFNATASLDQNQ